MKSLLIAVAVVMVFGVGNAMAQQYEVAPCGTKNFTTVAGVIPGGTICLDIYLTGVGGPQTAGGVWIDASGSLADISTVSAGRCMQDGSEGCTGPWTSGAGANVPYPAGVGTHLLIVGSQGGAAPDGDGDLIIGTVTLQNTGPNDATVDVSVLPLPTWSPIADSSVGAGQIVISQVLDDEDEDGVPDDEDNCPSTSNPLQEDTFPPLGNGIGDACDCESDFNCDGNCDATDVDAFLGAFGRSIHNNPCTNGNPCNGDVDCNVNVDADDVTMFLQDFGRSQFNNPCPPCEAGNWCLYEGDPFIKEYTDSGCLGMTQGEYSSSAFDECNIEDWATAEVVGDSIYVSVYVTYNCCSSIEVELSNEGNNLNVLVQEIFGRACFCNCCFRVDAEIAGLTPNEYTLQICSQGFNSPPVCETVVVLVP